MDSPEPPPKPDTPTKMRALISCTSENDPRWCDKVENLVLSLRTLGGELASAPVVVNFVDGVRHEFISRLAKLDATVRVVDGFPARVPAANKLRMLELVGEFDFDVLIALDCDMIVTGDVSEFLSTRSLRTVPESRDPFGQKQWRLMFDYLGITPPAMDCVMTSTGTTAYPFFKSGVLFVPRSLCEALRNHWGEQIRAFEDICDRHPDEISNRWFADQVGLAMAVAAGGLALDPLPVSLNFPMKVRIDTRFSSELRPPFIIHSSNQVDPQGFVLASRNRVVNPHIDEFNRRRAALLGRDYGRLRRPTFPKRIQIAAKEHGWYRSPLSKRLRYSAPARSLKRKLIG